jgi:polyribonucleotide nucleotidyltransferase
VVKVGDEIMVMVTEIDNLGRINLSRRAVLEGASGEDYVPEEHEGEIPSPLTRRTSTLGLTRSQPMRPPRQNGGGGGGFNRGRPRRPGGGAGGGQGGPRRPPMPR